MLPVLYYVRHGETIWNAEGRLQGQQDSALSATGRAQAAKCASILADLLARDGKRPTDPAYVSSPLGRARAMMDALRGALGLVPQRYELEPRLAEIAFGRWEGLTLADIMQREPAALTEREHDKWNFLPPGGESYAQVATRVGEWYAGLARDSVVTAHGGTARALMAHLGIVPREQAANTDIAQGVIYVFSGKSVARYG
jgi:broad specificity phosphatase PhoE